MPTLMQRFALLQKEKPDISQADLARATGAKPPSVNAWFTGETKSMKAQTAAIAASLYGVNALWLATGKGPKEPQWIINRALAGLGPEPLAPPISSVTLDQAIGVMALNFADADSSTRETCAALLASLARNPENHQKISTALKALLVSKDEVLQDPQLTQKEKDQARRLTEAAHAGEQFNLSQHGVKKSIT